MTHSTPGNDLVIRLAATFALLAAALLGGCATVYDVRYAPSPLEVAISDEATPGLSGRALVTVTAVRRPDRGEDRPAQFELVMRLENLGEVPFGVDPDSFQLVTADLAPLGRARLSPPQPPEIGPGETARIELAFPAEDGIERRNLSGLNLRWAVLFDGRRMVTGAGFQRVLPSRAYYSDDPFHPWRWSVGVGVGHFHAY
jgi:hypothetical protein